MGRVSAQHPLPLTLDPSPVITPKRILIIGPSNIGDAILASRVIAAVREGYPEAHLTLVVGSRATALFTDDPQIQALVDADRFDSLPGRLRLALALWRHRPQIVVDLRHTLYPFLLSPWSVSRYLRRPPRAIPHMRDRHLWKLRAQVPLLAERSRLEAPGLARGSRLKALGKSRGLEPTASSLEPRASHVSGAIPMWCSPKDVSHVDALWRRWGLDESRRVVVICPGARSHIKRWSADGFARVADRLIMEAGAAIVFSGEPDEEPIVEEIRSGMRQRAHSAVGLTTIRQLGALMQRGHLVITNDSASLHLASMLEAPTVAIFGPTDAEKYGPTAARSRTIRRRLFCAPCEQATCRFSHECMRFISADEVYDAAIQLLGEGCRVKGEGKT